MVNRRAGSPGWSGSRGGLRRAVTRIVERAAIAGIVAGAATATTGCGSGGGDGPVAPPTAPSPTAVSLRIAGQVLVAGGALPGGLRVFLRRDAAAGTDYATGLDSVGTFALDATLPGTDGDSLTLGVDVAASTTARTVHPVVVRATRATLPILVRPLLVPRAVTLAGQDVAASYAGQQVTVSLRSALTPVCASTTDPNCNSFYPREWLSGVALWPDAQLPIPLVLARARSSAPITAQDSAALWAGVRQMERDLGRPLFRPATATDFRAPDSAGYVRGVAVVTIDGSLGANAAYTNWLWDGARSVFAARSRFGSAAGLAAPSLVAHELLHALGFHHTCAWGSVMGGYGCPSTVRVSPPDAAGFALAYQVRRVQLAGVATTGLAEALAGETRLEGGIAARAAPAGVVTSRLRLYRGAVVRESGAN